MVEDGATMFMARIVGKPNDIMIFGRATGMKHIPGRDDASRFEIDRRDFKNKWPHYIRVDDAEFVDGTMLDCVSLNDLMKTLGSDSFVSTQQNALLKSGNTNPRKAYLQQAAVRLTDRAFHWLTNKLDRAFVEHGRISRSELAGLDWPKVDWGRSGVSR